MGEKTFAFEITGTNFKNVKVAGLATTAEYKGGALDLSDLYKEDAACKRNGWNAVTLYANDGTVLKESTDEGATGDYLVSMDNTGVIGSFNITFTGVNKCTGTIKKTIKVNAASLADKKLKARNLKLKVKFTTVATYTKAGAKPPVTAALVDNKDNVVAELSENIDYTVAYKNNTKQGTDVAYVTLKGMGNYTGTSGKTYFTIEKAGVSQVQVIAKDVVYNPSKSGKSAYYRISAKLSDEGKTLTSGKEIKFNKSDLKYTYFVDTTLEDGTVRAQGTEIDKKCKDKIPAGTVIKVSIPVTATATGPYSQDVSEVVGYYRVVEKDISKVTVTVKNGSEYKLYVNNGEAVKLTKSDLEVKEKGTGYILQPEDYDIVSFTDNNKVGTAKLTIAGKGKYGNTKTQNIKIKAKSLK